MGPEQNGAISLSEAVKALITESFSAALTRWQECRYFLCLFCFLLFSCLPLFLLSLMLQCHHPLTYHSLCSSAPQIFTLWDESNKCHWHMEPKKKMGSLSLSYSISSLPFTFHSCHSLTFPLSPAHLPLPLALLWSVRLLMSLKSP